MLESELDAAGVRDPQLRDAYRCCRAINAHRRHAKEFRCWKRGRGSVEELDFAVFDQRATVGNRRRLQVAAAGLVRAWRSRQRRVKA